MRNRNGSRNGMSNQQASNAFLQQAMVDTQAQRQKEEMQRGILQSVHMTTIKEVFTGEIQERRRAGNADVFTEAVLDSIVADAKLAADRLMVGLGCQVQRVDA